MAYLALNGLVGAVLTEDSDLLCYGCPTVRAGMLCGGWQLLGWAAARWVPTTCKRHMPPPACHALLGPHPAPAQVFFKMDKAGEGEEVRLADLPAAKELAFQVRAGPAGGASV